MRRIIVVVAVAVALASGLGAPAAQAQDRRPCVSKVEFYSLPRAVRTRAQVQALWEVHGRVVAVGRYREYVDYAACGYYRTEAHIEVAYRLGGAWAYEAKVVAKRAHLHAPARAARG